MEMVIVIVILGILAATAAPKFLNLHTDARISVLNGAKGAVTAANEIVFGKSAIEGEESIQAAAIDYHGELIGTRYGNIFAEEPKNIINSINTDMNVSSVKYSAFAPNHKKFTALGSAVYMGDERFNPNDVIASKCFLFVANVPYDVPELVAYRGELAYTVETSGC